VARIAEVLATKPRDEWLALFAKNRIPAGPINRVDEVTKDQDLLTKEFFYKSDSGYGEVPQVGLGITIDGQHHVHRKAPPTLGEDTEAILRGRLKLSPAQIAQLQQAKIVNE
jgi:crotonobetainyl-CoA:carnitine CoA-transferase CaiB-like acyl-CoA transferase